MKKLQFLPLLIALIAFSSCNKEKIAKLEASVKEKDAQIEQLEDQIDHMKSTSNSLLDRMADMSIINKEGAQSINKSLESINQQYSFIEDLSTKIQSKDSLNLALVMNLKRSLSNINDEDVQVEVKEGVVYVSISDKMLFNSGSHKITDRAMEVLGKLASVVNDHDDINILVEGHTDDVPIDRSCFDDNWDLSVKRATSVVRVLSEDYFVQPERLTAAGRGEFVPKAENDTEEGRSLNRRTEIIITPKLDQFFQLMEPPVVKN